MRLVCGTMTRSTCSCLPCSEWKNFTGFSGRMTGHLWKAIPWVLLLSAPNSAITEYKGPCIKSRAVITALTSLMIYLRYYQWTAQLNYSSYLEGLCKPQVFIVFREGLAQLEIISYMCRDLFCHLCAANVWKLKCSCVVCARCWMTAESTKQYCLQSSWGIKPSEVC